MIQWLNIKKYIYIYIYIYIYKWMYVRLVSCLGFMVSQPFVDYLMPNPFILK